MGGGEGGGGGWWGDWKWLLDFANIFRMSEFLKNTSYFYQNQFNMWVFGIYTSLS